MNYQNRRKNYFRLVAFLYIVLLIMLCITRFMFINDILVDLGIANASDMLSPFTTRQIRTDIMPENYGFWDIQSNIAIFIPLGVIASVSTKKPNLLYVAFISLSSTIIIETMQYILANGVSDINDIIFNFLGGIFGFVVYYIIYILNGKSKIKARDFISIIALMVPPFLIVYLYDMFILIGQRYSFSFLDIILFAGYFLITHQLFLKDLKKKLIIFYYITSIFLFLYFIFIFM